MKLNFKRTPEQIALVQAMASVDRETATKAQNMFAALVGPLLSKVYLQEDTTQGIFKQQFYPDDNDLSFPIDPYLNISQSLFTVWTTQQAGSVFTNEIAPGIDEVKFMTTSLESAWSMNQKYIAKARLDVVAMALTRLLQEVLLKTNYMCWQTLFKFVSEAVDTRNGNIGQFYASRTAGIFSMDDYNSLLTRFRRLNASWVGGTPSNGGGQPTDFYLSPEQMEAFRKMAYNPINTLGPNGLALSTSNAGSAGVVALPDDERAALYASAGVPTFYGINLNQLLELGKNQDYQVICSSYIGSTVLPYIGVAGSAVTFNAGTQELIIVVDATKDFAVKPIIAGKDYDATFTLQADDQFLARSKKVGQFGGVQIGAVCLENRAVVAMAV